MYPYFVQANHTNYTFLYLNNYTFLILNQLHDQEHATIHTQKTQIELGDPLMLIDSTSHTSHSQPQRVLRTLQVMGTHLP